MNLLNIAATKGLVVLAQTSLRDPFEDADAAFNGFGPFKLALQIAGVIAAVALLIRIFQSIAKGKTGEIISNVVLAVFALVVAFYPEVVFDLVDLGKSAVDAAISWISGGAGA